MAYRLICLIVDHVRGTLRSLHHAQLCVAIDHHEREVQRIDDEASAMRVAQIRHERAANALRRRLADLA